MALPLIALTHHEEETLTDAEFELEMLRHMDTDFPFDQESRKKAMEAVKEAGRKTREGAKAVAGKVNRARAGAKLPNTWLTVPDKEIAKRLIKSYKMYIEELGWKDIQLTPENYRVVYAESGLMVHAQLVFTNTSTTVYLVDSILGSTKHETNFITYKNVLSFPELTKQVDYLIHTLAFKFKNK